MRGRDRNQASDRRSRWGFAAGMVTACAALALVATPDVWRISDALFGGADARIAYPIRLNLPPPRASQNANSAASSPAAATSAEPTERDGTLSPANPDDTTAISDLAGRGRLAVADQEGVLPLDFDISPGTGNRAPPPGGSQIDTRKAISLNGVDAGSINVRVGRDSRIYLDRAGLAQALESIDDRTGARIVEGQGQQFLSVDDLRARGLAVRYDPVADRIRLET